MAKRKLNPVQVVKELMELKLQSATFRSQWLAEKVAEEQHKAAEEAARKAAAAAAAQQRKAAEAAEAAAVSALGLTPAPHLLYSSGKSPLSHPETYVGGANESGKERVLEYFLTRGGGPRLLALIKNAFRPWGLLVSV